MSRRGPWIVLLLGAPVFSGCMSAFDAGACTVHVPPVKAGSSFTYNATGRPWMFTLEPIVAEADSGSSNELLALPPGSTFQVTVAPGLTQRLGTDGGPRLTYHVSYTYHKAGEPRSYTYADEWVDASDSQPVQVALRRVFMNEDGETPLHMVRFTRFNRTPVLAAPLFWGQTLRQGDTGTIILPAERVPSRLDSNVSHAGTITWQVEHAQGVPCQAEVLVTYDLQDPGDRRHLEHLLTFVDGRPMPVHLLRQGTLEFSLTDTVTGDPSLELAPFHGKVLSVPDLKPSLVQDGCPGGQFGLPTSCFQASSATEEDSVVASWLDSHPGARVGTTVHQMGDPNTRIVDRWTFWWTTDTEGLEVIVDRQRPLLPGGILPDEIQVQSTPGEPLDLGPGPIKSIAAPLMRNRHDLYYGTTPLEVVECHWDMDYCGLGSHNGTGMPRATTGGGSGVSWGGLVIKASTGIILQENSWSEAAIGPPA